MNDGQITKTSSTKQLVDMSYVYYIINSFGATPMNYVSLNYIPLSRSRTGSKCSQWEKKISSGVSATTAMVASEYTLDYSRGTFSCDSRDGSGKVSPYVRRYSNSFALSSIAMPSFPSDLVTQTENTAKANFNTKVQNLLTPFQGQAFLAEFGKTVSMLRNPFSSARELLDQANSTVEKLKRLRSLVAPTPAVTGRIKRLNAEKYRAYSKAIANAWLELAYGVLPLVSDSKDICSALEQLGKETSTNVIKAGAKIDRSSTTTVVYAVSPFVFTNTYKTTYTCYTKIRATVAWDSSNAASIGAIGKTAFGRLADVPLTLWEIMPWSFLIDYFSNVGNILSSVFGASGNATCKSMTTVQVTTVELVSSICTDASISGLINRSGTGSTFIYTRRTVNRVDTVGTIPSLSVYLPAAPIKYVNMVALAVSKL